MRNLKKLKEQIEIHAQEIREALYKDFKKSLQEVDLTEIMPVISEIKDAVSHLKSWMRTRARWHTTDSFPQLKPNYLWRQKA